MKTAYEIEMERLAKSAHTVKLTDAKKKELAELDSKYAAKIAGREIALKGEMERVAQSGEFEKVEELEQHPAKELKALQVELETKKKELAELDSKYAAKIAGREIALKGEMERVAQSGEFEKVEELEQQLVKERKALQAELETKKEAVRSGGRAK